MQRLGKCGILDFCNGGLEHLLVLDFIGFSGRLVSPRGDGLEVFGTHHGAQARAADIMRPIVCNGGKYDPVFSGRANGHHFDVFVGCFQ